MGNPFSYIKHMFSKKDAKVLMLGLDNAGKTTILYQLKLGLKVETVPTMGFVHDTIEFGKFKLNVWDIAGQDSLRPLWKHYFQNTKAVIFVVDSSDEERFDLAKNELHKILDDDELKDATILLLANKMDQTDLPERQISNRIDFDRIKNVNKRCFGVVGLTGKNLREAMEWLCTKI